MNKGLACKRTTPVNVQNTIPFHDGFVFLWRILIFLLVEKYIDVPGNHSFFCLQGT